MVLWLFYFCDSEGIRTLDPQLRRLLLYPTELPNPKFFARKGSNKIGKSKKKSERISYCNMKSEVIRVVNALYTPFFITDK